MPRTSSVVRKELVGVLTIYRELGSAAKIGDVLHDIGCLHYTPGEFEAARTAFSESLDMFLSIEGDVGFEYVRMNLGSTLFQLGDFASAMELYREALPLYRQAGNQAGLAMGT